MNLQIHTQSEELFLEIARYLAAVDVYRALQCEPTWRPELTLSAASDEGPRPRAEHAPSAH